MKEKNSSNYITTVKSVTIGDKKRSVFVITLNKDKKITASTSKVSTRRPGSCSGCSRKRKIDSG